MKEKTKNLPELLAPAGTPEALNAALRGGADAVYLGGRLLNARMRAKNFDDSALRDAVLRCHDVGSRIYVTMNTIVFDRECDEAIRYAAFLYESGVDALIVSDLGLASAIKKYIPNFELHASTQLSSHNHLAGIELEKRGFSRMVVARELSRENIRSTVEKSPIEIEMFVHGALCVSHSGQCLCSWAMGGRSGNRGECAQPCRMKYSGGYPLSLRDNCLAFHLRDIIDSGVASLKIEGRLKSPDYVYSVTSTYRRLLDEGRDATKAEIDKMARVFSRDGFTDGYFEGKIDQKMLGVRAENQKSERSEKQIDLSRGERYEIKREKILLPEGKIEFDSVAPQKIKQNTARFYNVRSIPKSAESFFSRIYLPLERYEKANSVCDGVLMPPVIPDCEIEKVENALRTAYEKGARHAMVGNIGHIDIAKRCGYVCHGDYRFNAANRGTVAALADELEDIILSPELTLPRLRDITGAKAAIVYGHLPLMTLEKPVMRGEIRDEKGVTFRIISEGGRDILLNSAPIWMADREKDLRDAFIFNRHFIFTTENASECERVIVGYTEKREMKGNFKRIK